MTDDRYMSTFPHINKVNFFSAVDRWQATFILEEAARSPGTSYASTSSDNGGFAGLTAPIAQLLMAEPSLLQLDDIAGFIDSGIAQGPTQALSNIGSLGITPSLIRLLGSPTAARRGWARAQLPATTRRKISFDIMVRTGVRDEIVELCNDQSMEEAARWAAVRDILRSGGLSDEAIQKGLVIGESLSGGGHQGGRILNKLVPLLGTQSDRELRLSPTLVNSRQIFRHCWRSSACCFQRARIAHSGLSIHHRSCRTPWLPISRPMRLFVPCSMLRTATVPQSCLPVRAIMARARAKRNAPSPPSTGYPTSFSRLSSSAPLGPRTRQRIAGSAKPWPGSWVTCYRIFSMNASTQNCVQRRLKSASV